MVASRKKKLARHGAEKDENGHKFKVQVSVAGVEVFSIHTSTLFTVGILVCHRLLQNYSGCKMKSTIRAGSQNGEKSLLCSTSSLTL